MLQKRKQPQMPSRLSLFLLLSLLGGSTSLWAEDTEVSVSVPSLSSEQIEQLESPQATSEEPEGIAGWSEDVPENVENLDTSEPVQIEELPQEELSAEPEFLEQLAMLDKKELTKKKREEKEDKPDTPKTQSNMYVILQGLDKVTARVFTFEARLGEVVAFENLQIIPHYCKKSAPEEDPETTVFLEIHEKTDDKGTRQIFSGWMFSSSPTSSALEHPIYDVWVKGARLKEEKVEPEPKEEEKEPTQKEKPEAKRA